MDQLLTIIKDTNKTAVQVLCDFTESQKQAWPLAAVNFKGLETVEERSFLFDGFQIKVQFNPERMRSSAASVDKASIAARKCFLCSENRPVEQDAIPFGEDFLILVNPFPILKNHFTISSTSHVDQRFLPNVKSFLELAAAMEGCTVFYNGPECGASAPDHLHFQAGENGFMPIVEEFDHLKTSGRVLFAQNGTAVYAFDHYLRKMISIETSSLDEALKIINVYYSKFQAFQSEKMEPMMNVLCNYSNGKWTIHLFPRKAHRPSQFFVEGDAQILISPGSVDFGGVFITPRKEDFDKITKDDIVDIFDQLSVSTEVFESLTDQLKSDLNRI